ncbi:MAG: hypothetical protein ACR2KK_21545 [Acidimicrobiales bacterium]
MPIADVESEGWAPRPVGIGQLDRVLGGGLALHRNHLLHENSGDCTTTPSVG